MINVSVDDRKDIIIITISGEFYIENIQKVETIWNEQVMKDPGTIAINCGELMYIDSSAIGTLVKFLNSAMNRNIKLVFFDLNPSIKQIFKTARLNNFFTITSREKFEQEFLPR
jgi:anti-anti-sigma factor